MDKILFKQIASGASYRSAEHFYETHLAQHPISDEALNAHRRQRDRPMIDRMQAKYADLWTGPAA